MTYTYLVITLLGMIIIALVFLGVTYTIKPQPSEAEPGEIIPKTFVEGCINNEDCEWGVCSFGKCICFDDDQCPSDLHCNLATGVCE